MSPMFNKISPTNYPPENRPLLVWDGACGFCKYWVLFIKARTGDSIDFEPYQDVHQKFRDIPFEEFKKASRLIEPSGVVHTGPDSLYACMRYFRRPNHFWHQWYSRSLFFERLSDSGYQLISGNRPFLYQVTIRMFGKNPVQQRPFWILWLSGLILVVLLIAYVS